MNKLSKILLVTGLGVLLGNCFNASATSLNQVEVNLLQAMLGMQDQGVQQMKSRELESLDQDQCLNRVQTILDLSQQPILYLQPHIEQKPSSIHEWSSDEKERLKKEIENCYDLGSYSKGHRISPKDREYLAERFGVTVFDIVVQLDALGREALKSKMKEFLEAQSDLAPIISDIRKLASSVIYATESIVMEEVLYARGCGRKNEKLPIELKIHLINEYREMVLKRHYENQTNFQIAYELRLPQSIIRSITFHQ